MTAERDATGTGDASGSSPDRAGATADVAALAELAAACQQDPERWCAYAGEDAATIAAEVAEVLAGDHVLVTEPAAAETGPAGTRPAGAGAAALDGWLLGDIDGEVGRTWWWGPFVRTGAAWPEVAGRLYGRARQQRAAATMPDDQEPDDQEPDDQEPDDREPDDREQGDEELVADVRSTTFAAFAARHGFTAEEASVALRLDRGQLRAGPPPAGVEIGDLTEPDRATVARLHDELFAGSHTTGRQLVGATGARLGRLVARRAGRPVGYLATEHQHDGALYIDFVGVDPSAARRGVGRALVGAACRAGFAGGATHAHLTVRASNRAARALYRSLGFTETLEMVPYRRRS